jgi:membrane dipeptidase
MTKDAISSQIQQKKNQNHQYLIDRTSEAVAINDAFALELQQMMQSDSDLKSISRRQMLKMVGGATAFMINLGRSRVFAADTHQYSTRAIDLVGSSLVIDMLGVLAIDDQKADRWISSPEGMTAQELAAFKTSGINIFHNSFGIGGPTSYEDALLYMASYSAFITRYSNLFVRITTTKEMENAKKDGKIGIIHGLQGADEFRSPDDVKLFYGLGLRCAQLTYNTQNLIGSGSTERVDGGVTDFGTEIIKRMNEVGMLVDVSHCGDRTTLDAIELSAKPIAITHSNCRALCNHPRLKTDEAIRKLAAKGGVMGITGVRMFVLDHEPTTIENIVDHIDHVVKLTSIEHVGIGTDSDLDGYDDLPPEKKLREAYKSSYAFREKIDIEGFDHPRKVFDLTEALIRRGYSDSNIESILGGNFKRLLQQVWGS